MGNPAKINTVRCMAVPCEQIKREANHWFVVAITDVADDKGFICFRYTDGMELAEYEKPVCGPACAQRMFEKFLTTGEI